MWQAARDEGGVLDRPRWHLRLFIAAQIAIPTALILWRLATGSQLVYGLGWDMYS